MCMSAPKIPQPTQMQEVKQPDTANLRDMAKRNRTGMGGTVLTGPMGAAPATTGKTTVLGG